MSESVAAELAELRRTVQALSDEREIVRTLYRFTHTIDYGLAEEFVSLFTEDGVFDVRHLQGRQGARRAGREQLAAYLAGHARPPRSYGKHLLLQPTVMLESEDSARAESYFAVLEEQVGGPYLKTYGRYFDHLVKDGGRWRIKERRCEVEVRQPDYRFAGQGPGTH